MRSETKMYELPLFPLNTVLFPGMPLPLHIFEDRYKEMVADCIRENRPFGVVLIAEGTAEGGPMARPYAVGCTAEIAQVQPLDGGNMLIMTVGRERFRIVRLGHNEKPYLVGMVEHTPLLADDMEQMEASAATLEPLVSDYLHKLAMLGTIDMEPDEIPSEPLGLIYLAATLIQLPPDEKQAFLAAERATALAHSLARAYRRELALMRTMPTEDIGIFSIN